MQQNRYEYKTYPTAWAIVEDPVTGVPRVATQEELLELGLTGPKFEQALREVFDVK